MTYLWFEGHKLNARTRDMLIAARKLTGVAMYITQGGYNKGGVVASAGTHDGGGALDIRAIGLTDAQRREVVAALRAVGFAAWLRDPDEGDWPWHIHAEALDDDEASAGAKRQWTAYKNHRNGLANNGPDEGRPLYSGGNWESFKAAHPQMFTSKDITITTACVTRLAEDELGVSGECLGDCYQIMNIAVWFYPAMAETTRPAMWQAVAEGNWERAAELLRYAIKIIQSNGGLTQDGIYGPVTAKFLATRGYQIR